MISDVAGTHTYAGNLYWYTTFYHKCFATRFNYVLIIGRIKGAIFKVMAACNYYKVIEVCISFFASITTLRFKLIDRVKVPCDLLGIIFYQPYILSLLNYTFFLNS